MSRPEPLIVDELPPALTVKQTARLWSCSVDVIYEAIARSDCPCPSPHGRVIRLPRAAVLGGHRSQRRRAGLHLPLRR